MAKHVQEKIPASSSFTPLLGFFTVVEHIVYMCFTQIHMKKVNLNLSIARIMNYGAKRKPYLNGIARM